MFIELLGHSEVNMLQSLTLLFFPVSSFENRREDNADGHFAKSTLFNGKRFMTAKTVLSDGERSVFSVCRAKSGENEKELVARSFYGAGVKLTGIQPKWGTITGIRPAKLIALTLSRGLTERQTEAELYRRFLTQPEKTALCADVLKGEKKALELLRPRSFSLYVAIPFCPTRCAYCSFVSHSIEHAGKLISPYVELLCREIGLIADMAERQGLDISTIYIGGGTPTTLSAEQLDRLMRTIGSRFDLKKVLEYTVEAGRPDTVTPEKLATILKNGANRVSVNPQTLSDATLEAIGRKHTAEDFRRAYALAKEAGFKVINTDLIAGLPGETAEDFKNTVEGIVALSPENVTVHTLSIKKSSRIKSSGSFGENADQVERMLSISSGLLRGVGYRPYYLYRQKNTLGNFENVGYSKPGLEGLYNIYIMGEYQTILAAGAGGVTKVVGDEGTRFERVWNYKYPYEYIDNFPKIEENIRETARILEKLKHR